MQHVRLPGSLAIATLAAYRIRSPRDVLSPGRRSAHGLALLAALLLAAGIPAAHVLLAELPPLLLGGLLCLGATAAMAVTDRIGRLAQRRSWRRRAGAAATASDVRAWAAVDGRRLPRANRPAVLRSGADWARLAGAVLAGGVFAPVCLLGGLAVCSASAASLLLELEAVFAAVGWWILSGRAPAGHAPAGLLAIAAGALVLAWPASGDTLISAQVSTRFLAGGLLPGMQLVALGCLGWALERLLLAGLGAPGDPSYILWKGLLAGVLDLLLAFALHCPLPSAAPAVLALILGAAWFGVGRLLAQRAAARLSPEETRAWEAGMPFLGVAIALWVFLDLRPHGLLVAAALMGVHLLLSVRAAQPSPPVEVDEPRSAVAPSLRAAYRRTDYHVHGDPPMILRIGACDQAFARLMRRHGTAAAAILTAWNPQGRALDADRNAARQEALRQELTAAGHVVLDGIGVGQDPDIPGERSLIALGMTRAAAVDCGRRHAQNAIVWIGADACPQLVMLR